MDRTEVDDHDVTLLGYLAQGMSARTDRGGGRYLGPDRCSDACKKFATA